MHVELPVFALYFVSFLDEFLIYGCIEEFYVCDANVHAIFYPWKVDTNYVFFTN
jgi:hypothetical protein